MAKETGLGARLFVSTVDASNDTRSVDTISKRITPIDMTGIDKSAHERLAGQLDGNIDWTSFLNTTGSHLTYDDLPRTDIQVSYFHRATLGVPAASVVAKQLEYGASRSATAELTLPIKTAGNTYWLDWGLAVTAGKRTDTTATNGTGVDFGSWGAPASFGLQAYLHVFSFTGTSATIKLQGSSDNGVGDAFADITGGAFTTVTGATFERIQTARNQAIERYMRVVTTGTFTNLQFAVMAVVNATDMTGV
jgi:hypothetical protein